MGLQEALRRRDVTINAMAVNLQTYELIDPFNGLSDLENKILRPVDVVRFKEDPLRLFRAMAFIARFRLATSSDLDSVCSAMDISNISRERISDEFEKLFLKSEKPSLGILWLEKIGRLQEILPELYATISVKQDPRWHPEGSVYNHTMQAIDAAARLHYDSIDDRLAVLFASLCHDLGKVTMTQVIDGRIRSIGHANAGIAPARALFGRISIRKKMFPVIEKLIRYHMEPFMILEPFVHLKHQACVVACKRLAAALAPHATIKLLMKLCIADRQGRNPVGDEPLKVISSGVERFIRQAQECGVYEKFERPVLSGGDISHLVPPGREMGRLLKRAYDWQIDRGVQDKKLLIKFVDHVLRSERGQRCNKIK
jgi:tRNA nucleotidyltransferase (CCA-adding enzyme)